MKRLALCAAGLLLATAAAASAQDRGRGSYANPSALIAAEIALRHLAEEKGQWAAWRENAAPGAELLAPDPVAADPWLKGRSEPAKLPGWEPYAAWISCDGSFGAVEGGWREPGSTGRYAAVWQRQEDGGYKWVIRQRIGHDHDIAAPDMLSARVAECPPPRESKPAQASSPPRKRSRKGWPAAPFVDAQAGWSADRSFYWRSGRDAGGAPRLQVAIRKDGAMAVVLGEELGEPPAG